jgi:hypothetical protein
MPSLGTGQASQSTYARLSARIVILVSQIITPLYLADCDHFGAGFGGVVFSGIAGSA